jgi:hypothetical protein
MKFTRITFPSSWACINTSRQAVLTRHCTPQRHSCGYGSDTQTRTPSRNRWASSASARFGIVTVAEPWQCNSEHGDDNNITRHEHDTWRGSVDTTAPRAAVHDTVSPTDELQRACLAARAQPTGGAAASTHLGNVARLIQCEADVLHCAVAPEYLAHVLRCDVAVTKPRGNTARASLSRTRTRKESSCHSPRQV